MARYVSRGVWVDDDAPKQKATRRKPRKRKPSAKTSRVTVAKPAEVTPEPEVVEDVAED